jgi:hypothetical protein
MIRIHGGKARAEVVLPMRLPACMGGWCELRDDCTRYHAKTGADPVERLCNPGRDGMIDGYPVRIVRPVGTWERRHEAAALLRAAQPFDALVDRA